MRLDHVSDVAVLENQSLRLASSPDGNIDHRSGQIVGPNHLAPEKYPKRGIEGAQQAVADVRFLPGFHGIDVCRPEDIDVGNPAARSAFSASPL